MRLLFHNIKIFTITAFFNFFLYKISISFTFSELLSIVFLIETNTKLAVPLIVGIAIEQHALKNVNNGRELTVNRSLDGSIYLG